MSYVLHMIYLMSYELCLMSYLVSCVILSSYDLTALVYVLLLGLLDLQSRDLCRCILSCVVLYAFLRTCRFCYFYEFLFCLRNLHT